MDLNDPLGKKIGKKKIWFLTFCFEEQKLSPVENPSFTVACPLSLQRFSLLRCVCEVVRCSSPVLSASATALALPDLYRYASALFFFLFSPSSSSSSAMSVEGLDLWLIFGHVCACRCWCSVFSLSLLFFRLPMARPRCSAHSSLSLPVALCC